MKQKTIDEQTMYRYLLGELPEDEEIEFEQDYFADNDCYAGLLIVEDQLIDDYVYGELSEHERKQFEKHFFSSPQRRERVEFARTLKEFISEKAPEEKFVPETQAISFKMRAWWQSLLDFPFIPKPVTLLAVFVVCILLGKWWLTKETVSLQDQLAQQKKEQMSLLALGQELQQQLTQQHKRDEQLAAQLQREQEQRTRLEQELAKPQLLRPVTVSFVLTPGLVRDIEGTKRLIIPQNTQSVKLQLDLENEDVYKSYRAVLKTAEGDEIWSQNMLKARQTDSGNAIILDLPSLIFSNNDYMLILYGSTASRKFEETGSYPFTIERR